MSKDVYRDRLAEMTDEELLEEIEKCVWFSAFAANNSRSDFHWKVDLTHDETRRREKPWLYQRGWNKAYRSCGHSPSDHDLERATEAFYKGSDV
jgi:hypothetical protein